MPTGPLPRAPRSILIVMLSAVGDAIQVLPVVMALRRTFPATHISWVIQPGPHSLVDGHQAVDEFVLFHRERRSRKSLSVVAGARNLLEASTALRESARRQPDGRFDLLLDLQTYLKAGLLTALAPARVKVGFDGRRARDLNRVFTTHQIPPHPSGFGHIQDQYLEFLTYIGVDPEPFGYGLELTAAELSAQREFFSQMGGPTCAVVVGTSDPRKNWMPDRYRQVMNSLQEDFGLTPIMVGGRSRGEEAMVESIRAQMGGAIQDARGGGLRRLLWLLQGSNLVISPDTGPLHMARAMEVPVVGLFGFTNPRRSGPYRRFSHLVADGYARFPGEDYGVSMTRRPGGMARVTVEMVLKKVEKALDLGG
jgi:heptosyltransferase I